MIGGTARVDRVTFWTSPSMSITRTFPRRPGKPTAGLPRDLQPLARGGGTGGVGVEARRTRRLALAGGPDAPPLRPGGRYRPATTATTDGREDPPSDEPAAPRSPAGALRAPPTFARRRAAAGGRPPPRGRARGYVQAESPALRRRRLRRPHRSTGAAPSLRALSPRMCPHLTHRSARPLGNQDLSVELIPRTAVRAGDNHAYAIDFTAKSL